jgi:hypothetical protein
MAEGFDGEAVVAGAPGKGEEEGGETEEAGVGRGVQEALRHGTMKA